MALEAFFLPAPGGQRFCLFHPPAAAAPAKGAVLFIHPFAEEMNKSRPMAALQARALAGAGFGVLQMDLLGCGDSSGDFGDATWDAWLEDVVLASEWLRRRLAGPFWLWGLRAGCLVAAAAAPHLPHGANFLFWHPTPSGKLFLQQFLRLKMAGALLDGDAQGMTRELRRQSAAGETVEVAGYPLSPALARGLEEASLAPAPRPGQLVWLEVSTRPEGGLNPAAKKALAAWQLAGHQVKSRAVGGQQFWQTVETARCRGLIDTSLELLSEPVCP